MHLRWLARLLLGAAAVTASACRDHDAGAPEGARADDRVCADLAPDSAGAQLPGWRVTELTGPRGFRAFGWGAADTLWGIARGHLAAASLRGDTLRQGQIAWSVQTDPHHRTVSWTNAAGLWLRDGDGAPRNVDSVRPPDPEHTGPEVLWAPGGTRALLTWTAEAGPTHSVLEEDGTHRVLRARLRGYMAGAPVAWLNRDTAVVPVVALGPRAGPPAHRESGYRGDIALLDVVADTMWRITDVADGEYLVGEGLLAPDTLLVGVATGRGWPERHAAVPLRGGPLEGRLEQPGRAAGLHGCIALLRPRPDEGRMTEWELLVFGHGLPAASLGRFSGHELRLLWHRSARRLAVAQESELPGGYRTLVLELD